MGNAKILNKLFILDNQKIKCDRCLTLSRAYYVKGEKIKALFINCSECGNHAAKYIEGLPIPIFLSESYLKRHKDNVPDHKTRDSGQTTMF